MIVVPGNPVPKGRPRFSRFGTYTPKRTKDYEALVAKCYKEQSGIYYDGACLYVQIEAVFAIPKSYTKKEKAELKTSLHIRKPDIDNLIKSVLDALNGVAFADDGCVAAIKTTKRWADEGEEGHLSFSITPIDRRWRHFMGLTE